SVENWDFKYRLEPLLAEIGYFSPTSGTNVFLQNLYDVNSGNQAFVLDSTFRTSYDGSSASFGMVNYSADKNSFLFTTKFIIAPKNMTWRADMGIDFNLNKDSLSAYSKHIKVYKDFHDFGIMLGIRDRNDNLSFSFRINIMCGAPEKKATDKRIDNYWYPWRDDRMQRDNF
ncbi:MAG: hypothetical protein LBM71_01280, partial [Elusimicrobiota bacterium]|nr:hypothetical protein [Elusimicrobiota bacterium]